MWATGQEDEEAVAQGCCRCTILQYQSHHTGLPVPPRSAVLLPIVLTVYIMWWFLEFFDGFFSPLYVRPHPAHYGARFELSRALMFAATLVH